MRPKIFLIVFLIMTALLFYQIRKIKVMNMEIMEQKDIISKLRMVNDELITKVERDKEGNIKKDSNSIYPEEPVNMQNIKISALSDDQEIVQNGISKTVKEIRENLAEHPEIIPYNGVMGGTMGFYDTNSIKILNKRWLIADFEDGHITGQMIVNYGFTGNKIQWTIIDSYLE